MGHGPGRRAWVVSAVVVAALACTATTAGAAPAPVTTAAGCASDPAAQGRASRASADSRVSVPRADGRVDEFQLFYDDTATSPLPFLWHRSQDEPGGPYGDWERVSAATVGPKSYYVTAAENGDGRIEVFFSTYGTFCHTVEQPGDGTWTAPEGFGLSPAPYHGGLVLFRERDGSLDAFASSRLDDRSMEVRTQRTPADGWGPAQSMGRVPDPNVGLSQPGTITELPDGRLSVTAREWNRDRFWRTVRLAPHGAWGPWQLITP
ncbi:hypothetical protein GCM10010218_53120 [Streptomyces mashuensis]|uniref:Uncharacterized protein n=1 Tax=Streptomyces mashuensis TaxID=33904 RepID=A0A919B907_9ACTN|nr:hypothetical protein [Streptomyces mashuensis]GHF65040.1 hypothetical protein GCM10010218_53120 [Streptomyces mashuensis]